MFKNLSLNALWVEGELKFAFILKTLNIATLFPGFDLNV